MWLITQTRTEFKTTQRTLRSDRPSSSRFLHSLNRFFLSLESGNRRNESNQIQDDQK